MPSLDDHTPPASNFLSNAGNCAHCNRLGSVAMQPHREHSAAMVVTGTPALASSPPMMERVQKRVFDKFRNVLTTPQTRRVVAKVHNKLAHRDPTFTTAVKCYEDVQSLQEITSICIKLQCTMEE
jgi:hypothetical protein